MTRFACTATLLLIATVCSAGVAAAQSTSAESPWYAEFNAAATLGHRSSSSVGGEGGYRVTDLFDAFIEAGHMPNVGSVDLDRRAQLVATALGGTANASYHVNYFDFGVRYHVLPMPTAHPYVALGVGVAQVRAATTVGINGVVFGPESIAFGSDLNGTEKKAILMIGFGATWNLGKRYFIDGTYRFGHIFPKTGTIEGDQGINTQRVQVGFGARF